MKIMICPKCGKKIHIADRCLFCGNETDFKLFEDNQNIHENAAKEVSELPSLVKSGSFGKAVDISRVVLRWMPSCAEVFWIRLLAKNKCKNDAELVQKGISFEDSADFFNAMKYASVGEREVYSELRKLVDNIKVSFEKTVKEHEYEEKKSTPIIRCQGELSDVLNTKRKHLFELWSELEKVEQEMYGVEQDCKLLVSEHRDALERIKTDAANVKSQTYRLNECNAEELHKYQVRLGSLLNQSDQSKSAIDMMRKQHPWIGKFNSLVEKRDGIVRKISSELSELKSYETRVQSTVSEIERIEKRHQLAMRSLSEFDFMSIHSLIGIRKYEEVLAAAGLAVISDVRGLSKN